MSHSMYDRLQSLFVPRRKSREYAEPVRLWRRGSELALAVKGDERVREYSEFTCLDVLQEGNKRAKLGSKVVVKVTSFVGPECHYKLTVNLDGIRMVAMAAGMLGFPVLLHFLENGKNAVAKAYKKVVVSANSVCIDVRGHLIVCVMAHDRLAIIGNIGNSGYWSLAEWLIDIPLEDERLFDHFHAELVRHAEIANA